MRNHARNDPGSTGEVGQTPGSPTGVVPRGRADPGSTTPLVAPGWGTPRASPRGRAHPAGVGGRHRGPPKCAPAPPRNPATQSAEGGYDATSRAKTELSARGGNEAGNGNRSSCRWRRQWKSRPVKLYGASRHTGREQGSLVSPAQRRGKQALLARRVCGRRRSLR